MTPPSGPESHLLPLLQCFGVGLELVHSAGIESGFVCPNVAVLIDEHESGAVVKAVADGTYVKGVHGKQVDGGEGTGEKRPLRRGAAETVGVGVQDGRGVALRINGDGDQADVLVVLQLFREPVHLRRHARTRPGAAGVNEVDYPDFTSEFVAVERVAFRIGQRKVRHCAVVVKFCGAVGAGANR